MKLSKRFLSAVVVLTMVSTQSRAGVCPPFAESIVIAHMTSVEVAMKAFTELLMRALASQMEQFSKLEISALRVVTAQVSTAAKAQINASIALKQGEMAALGVMESTKRMSQIVTDYSMGTGQGTDPCAQLTAQSRLAIAGGQTAAIADEMLTHIDAGPGKYGSAESFVKNATGLRKALFLTEDEAKLGYGRSSTVKIRGVDGRQVSLAGLDVNASVLFLDSNDRNAAIAKQAYLNNLAGPPDAAIDKDLANREDGQRYLAAKQRRDAMMSIGLNSLATVAAENTPNTELGMSEMEAMRKVVAMYYGSSLEARKRWTAWTGQSPRGLMVDGLKIEAAQLMMLQKTYQQGQRMESLLGALVALEAGKDYTSLAANAAALKAGKSSIR